MNLRRVVVISKQSELRQLAQKISQQVLVADDAIEAVDIVATVTPDLILLDSLLQPADIRTVLDASYNNFHAAIVVVGNNGELSENLADALLQFMRNNGMNPLGRVTAAGANPCLGCPDSLSSCEFSAVVAGYGRLERIGKSMYNPIENQIGALKSARILGQRLGHKVEHLIARGFASEN